MKPSLLKIGDCAASFPRRSRGSRKNTGFTILELLVASAVSLLLITLLLSTVQGISANYTRTQGGITRQGDASLALDQLIQDLEGIVVPSYPKAEALQITPEVVGQSTNAIWLTFLTTATDKDNSSPDAFTGATRAVSYRIAYQNTVSAATANLNPSFAIYRSLASAEHTFENFGPTVTNLQSQYWTSIPPSPSPAPLPPISIESFLAENVVAFSLRFLRADNGEWTPPNSRIRVGRDGSYVNDTQVPGGFVRAEVSMTVLSPEGSQRVRDGVLTLNEAINRHGRRSVRQTSSFHHL